MCSVLRWINENPVAKKKKEKEKRKTQYKAINDNEYGRVSVICNANYSRLVWVCCTLSIR